MKTPAQIIDAVATAKGYVVPVAAHFPLSREFAEACVLADREQREELTPRERQKIEETK